MREIKFRAWNTRDGELWTAHGFQAMNAAT